MPKRITTQTLAIATHAAKPLTRFLQRLFERRYRARRFAKTLFAMDIALFLTSLILVGWVLSKTLFAPPTIQEQVWVDATVAPSEVVSGASSTLVFRYQNTSDETLEHAELALTFPAHFSLQAVESEQTEVAKHTYELGSIAPGAVGSLKIRGVMFGDVGGEQMFTTTMRFVYGEKNTPVELSDAHTFHPVRSTLTLELVMPERVVAGQTVPGEIRYKNTGEIDFPEITIEPTWPDGFALVSSSPTLTNGRFLLKGLTAGEEGTIEFIGRLPATESASFSFAPSFTFGETFYRQETLVQEVVLLPAQLSVKATFAESALTPGGTATVNVHVEHIGQERVEDVQVTLTTTSPFFTQKTLTLDIGELLPGDTSDGTAEFSLARSVSSSSVSAFENLTASVNLSTNYVLPDGVDQTISLYTGSVNAKVTSPATLEAFARYTSPQGDQIGRGSLPPYVGEETKYWVFLTVKNTTNTLSGVKLEADLGESVVFTGKQSVSVGDSLSYDEASNTVTWNIASLSSTLDPDASVVSVAFEVALTPTEAMLGTTPKLIDRTLMTARDTWTGAFVTAYGSTITTNLPHDSMAAGKGTVE